MYPGEQVNSTHPAGSKIVTRRVVATVIALIALSAVAFPLLSSQPQVADPSRCVTYRYASTIASGNGLAITPGQNTYYLPAPLDLGLTVVAMAFRIPSFDMLLSLASNVCSAICIF